MNLVIWQRIRHWHEALPLHWALAILVSFLGFFLLQPGFEAVLALPHESWVDWVNPAGIGAFLGSFGLVEVSRLTLGLSLEMMALGLIFRARIAWTVSLFLLLGTATYFFFRAGGHVGLAVYSIVLGVILLAYWRRFDRSSLAAGSLFALVAVGSLLVYAVFGTLYLGDEFHPAITDAATAFYFSIVSMSTVGYGDITPQTIAARLFTASVIVLGITVFATSISAIAGPIIRGNIQRLVKGRLSKRMRKNHIIIAGVTPLAQSVYKALKDSGRDLTVIVPQDSSHGYPPTADIIVGDATDSNLLQQAGAAEATYILALRSDDSENAFIVLAGKETGGKQTRTVALVNTAMHLRKIKQVNPDVIFSLQSLGAEILARLVTGRAIDNDMITALLFPQGGGTVVVDGGAPQAE